MGTRLLWSPSPISKKLLTCPNYLIPSLYQEGSIHQFHVHLQFFSISAWLKHLALEAPPRTILELTPTRSSTPTFLRSPPANPLYCECPKRQLVKPSTDFTSPVSIKIPPLSHASSTGLDSHGPSCYGRGRINALTRWSLKAFEHQRFCLAWSPRSADGKLTMTTAPVKDSALPEHKPD